MEFKIGIFAYDFSHKKTYEGLANIIVHGFRPACILAAPKVKLDIYTTKLRAYVKGIQYPHPREIARRFGIPYHSIPHNESVNLIKDYKLDIGIILGARILSKEVISAFNIGVLNTHPALLPEIRGLDPVQWAILKELPQGASIHLINEKVDKGLLLDKREVDVYKDDTFVDILLRINNMEQVLLIDILKNLDTYLQNAKPLEESDYHNGVPVELEPELLEKFEKYKKKRGK